ncbi:hypothetical protein [Archangium sp.]|uniref:hypothetical protein n=1 Tax=Archangium sp. TaxID=1872627 RepID=UPI002D3C2DAC|nr:hypothetical protein [Archangium sp.]HYO56735.1 hypothetical protein [Archangium sp.]
MAAGSLPLYMLEEDVPLLHEQLNSDPEIAFILRDGPERWRAVWQVEDIRGKMMLWHVPGGPLPLRHYQGEATLIEDPFAGWHEERPGLDNSVPNFGAGCQVNLLMRIWVPGWNGLPKDFVDISTFSWSALRVTRSPPESTRRWWKRFRTFVSRHARLVTRWGPLDGPRADIWAMPAALRALQTGMERAENPWLG